MKQIAIYLRVSTDKQTTQSQTKALRDYCARRGWREVIEYSDRISGAKESREGLDRLMRDVSSYRLQAVVAFRLDRLGRSLSHLARLIDVFTSHQVALIIPEQGIDTSDANPVGKLQLGLLMAVAEFERSIIQQRVNAGLQAARARGVRLGRPSNLRTFTSQVSELRQRGRNVLQIARELGLPYSSTRMLCKETDRRMGEVAEVGALQSPLESL